MQEKEECRGERRGMRKRGLEERGGINRKRYRQETEGGVDRGERRRVGRVQGRRST